MLVPHISSLHPHLPLTLRSWPRKTGCGSRPTTADTDSHLARVWLAEANAEDCGGSDSARPELISSSVAIETKAVIRMDEKI